MALNIAAYLDMLVRGRAASKLPGDVAGRLADDIGLPLDFDLELQADTSAVGDDSAEDADDDDEPIISEKVANRQEALGALLGYSNGLGIGLGYAILRIVLP